MKLHNDFVTPTKLKFVIKVCVIIIKKKNITFKGIVKIKYTDCIQTNCK